jgi:hypothetical protein
MADFAGYSPLPTDPNEFYQSLMGGGFDNNQVQSNANGFTNMTGFQDPNQAGIGQGLQQPGGGNNDMMNRWLGGKDQVGILPTAVNTGLGLAQTWLGFQQMGMAKEQMAFQKDAFNKNFAMQTDAYNRAKGFNDASAAAQNA